MATTNNPMLAGMSGIIGGFLFKQCNGVTVVTSVPTATKRAPSALQLLHRSLFAEAVRWAKAIVNHPVRRSEYAHLAKDGKRLNDVLRNQKYEALRLAAGLAPKGKK